MLYLALLELALPDRDDGLTVLLQRLGRPPVTLDIAGELRLPKLGMHPALITET